MKNKYRHEFQFFLLTASMFILIIILSIEIYFRKKSIHKTSSVVYSSAYGWKNKPVNQKNNNISYRINKQGFRGKDLDLYKKSAAHKIIFLGDSYTFGVFIPEKHIFPRIFENIVNKRSKSKYEVMNIAVPGWGTDQQMIFLKTEASKYNPKYVILMVCPNDIRDVYGKKFFYLDDNTDLTISRRPDISLKNRIFWHLASSSHLFNYLQKKLGYHYGYFNRDFTMLSYEIQTGFLINETDYCIDKHLYQKELPQNVQSAYDLFDAIVLEIKKWCDLNNTKLILSLTPTKFEFDGHLVQETYQRDRLAIHLRKVAKKERIPYFDLWNAFENEAEVMSLFIDHEFHYSRKGHYYVGKMLASYFLDNFIEK